MRLSIIIILSIFQLVFSQTGWPQPPERQPTRLAKLSLPAGYLPTRGIDADRTRGTEPKRGSQPLVQWIQSNVSPQTGLPLSFAIQNGREKDVYALIGKPHSVEGVIERTIVKEGLVIYDGAVAQIVMTLFGGQTGLKRSEDILEVYWQGKVGKLPTIRAGGDFIYDPSDPNQVSGDPDQKGKRGFIFRIINANGRYEMRDPLDGKKRLEGFPNWPDIHWEDWKPVAGENAWVTMAAMHLFHKKYYDPAKRAYQDKPDAMELRLAEELARAALLLRAENGGIRMAPIGTYRNPKDFIDTDQPRGSWWYHQISTENNISWYCAFRMLYQVTGEAVYREAMEGIEHYFRQVYNPGKKYFYQGMHYNDGQWRPNDEHFALDVQTWAIAALGPQKIDEWFGTGRAFALWDTAKQYSGFFAGRHVLGVGYTREHDQISVEWTAGAILAARLLADHYAAGHPDLSQRCRLDQQTMRHGVEVLRADISPRRSAYAYSLKRKYIPFGWYSHVPEVLSMASTGWIAMVDHQINPFELEI